MQVLCTSPSLLWLLQHTALKLPFCSGCLGNKCKITMQQIIFSFDDWNIPQCSSVRSSALEKSPKIKADSCKNKYITHKKK